MARLSAGQRRGLSSSAFVFPDKAPGPGSFPIPDRNHALAALRLCARVPGSCGAVRAAVCRKFGIGCSKRGSAPDAEDRRDHGVDESSEPS